MLVNPTLSALWAKSGTPWHDLPGHLLDTAAAALTVLRREPRSTRLMYARALGLDEEEALRFIVASVGTHDLGKASPVFQAQWEHGRARAQSAGFPFASREVEWVRHDVLTEVFLGKVLSEHGLKWRPAKAIARSVAAHHGFLATKGELSLSQIPDVAGTGPWEAARRDLVTLLFDTVEATVLPTIDALDQATSLGIMALASFSDWIASDPHYFPRGRDACDPEAYWRDALHLAALALTLLGWRTRSPLVKERVPFKCVFPSLTPNPLQETVARAVAQAETPVLLIVEAPTGTGKTEAALYAHIELQRLLGHRGLYVALPTMATGNGMFPRVKDVLDRLAPGTAAIDLQLQHGTAFLNATFQTLHPQGMGDPGRDQNDTVIAHAWFTARKRAMLSEYGVGTVDQALLGVLRVRHHFVRLWGLGNRTIILDEVHAYDTYTSGLIEVLVRWLKILGSSVIVMSATLTRSRRAALLSAYGVEPPQEQSCYPRLTTVQDLTVQSIRVRHESSKALQIRSVSRRVEELAPHLLDEVREGGCLACIVNTVDRAQRLYRELGDGEPVQEGRLVLGKQVDGIPVYLLHARYPAEDRQGREDFITRVFGEKGYESGVRPHRAILVATQVIEQSLNLDFDVMVTDLAPVDLILQRAGRLHRFDLADLGRRPGRSLTRPRDHTGPRLLVAGLAEEPPDLETEHWDDVYGPYVLLMSWWVLHGLNMIRIPEDVEEVVEQVYEGGVPHLPADMTALFQAARARFLEEQKVHSLWASKASISDPEELLADIPQDMIGVFELDDDEESALSQIPLTRLGSPSVTVVLVHRIGGRLFLDAAGTMPIRTDRPIDGGTATALFLRSVRLSRSELYKTLIRAAPPPAWRKNPLVRHIRPVELVDAKAVVGRTVIRLDPQLGIVYER